VVNTLNNGAIPFLADDDAVETRAAVGRDGAKALPCAVAGSPLVRNVMRSVKVYERYAVQAALSGNRDDAIRALMANPLVQDVDAAKACFDEMLAAHREYLPAFFK
jgi:6-phospho-beta-glucosidase